MVLHLPIFFVYTVMQFLALLHELRYGISTNLQMKITCALLRTFYFYFVNIYNYILHYQYNVEDGKYREEI